MALAARAGAVQEFAGVTVVEAEAFATNISPRSAHSWVVSNAVTGFSGGGYAEAIPNSGAGISAGWDTNSPELQYPVTFSLGGTHYVWTRAFATNNNDDSVHVGLDGTTNSANSITLGPDQLGAWYWTTNRLGGAAQPTVSGGAGDHTLHLWMREDGARIDRVLLTTNANLLPQIGNSWHIPDNAEPAAGLDTMRVPLQGITSNTAVQIFTGNQFQGAGNAADQAQTGSQVFYRRAGETNWTGLQLFFDQTAANNKYYLATIPAGTFAAGDVVQYYARVWYTDRLPTFHYGNDSASFETELETVAQADPFSYDVEWPLNPEGNDYLPLTIATIPLLEVRVYTNSGNLVIAGPDLAGNPLGNVLTFAARARAGGEWHRIGRILDGTVLTNGLEFVQQFSTTSVVTRFTILAEGVLHYEVVNWGGMPVTETEISTPSDASEHFYGFGEKFNAFDQAGKRVRMLTRDVAGDKGDNSYKVVPWFMSTRGYGFHLDSSAESFFDMRNQQADRCTISCLFPALKYNVVFGPRLPDVLRRYTGYTGRPPSSPAWAFAPWMSSDIWHNGGEVRYVISKYRQLGIPGSVFVFDSPWEVGYNDFTWNTTQWSNSGTYEGTNWPGFTTPANMMAFLRTNGFKVVVWMTPFVNTSSVSDGVGGQNTGQAATYAAGAASNYFVRASAGGPPLLVNWWKGTGSPVDYTHPGARAWVSAQLSNLVAQSGGAIGGFKTDDGESGSSDSNVYIPTNAIYSDGRSGVEMRNGYSLDYHRTIWNVLGTNGLLFSRSGFAGNQAYPGCWAGDNEPNFGANGIQGVVIAGQSAAMCGYSMWSHDVGGYQDSTWSSTPANLFMRWAQFGALTPIMQMHRKVDLGRQYPWSLGDEALSNYVAYARLHTALFPYLYTCAAEATQSGLPIMRPLVLMDQADVSTHSLQHTYLLGDDLLVAVIITNNAVARDVYLPPGNWCDYFQLTTHTGGQNLAWANANQAQTPLFVRQGGIIPMLPTNVATLCDATYVANPAVATWDDGALEYWVYPGTNSSFSMYDGTTLGCQSNGTVITLRLESATRPVLLRVLAAAPFSVERDGVTLPHFTNAVEFAQAPVGWRAVAPFVHVKLAHGGGATEIAFGPDSVGDGISDSWRQRYFGVGAPTNAQRCATCDADGDGLDNIGEYQAGTVPTNALSRLRIADLNGQTRLVTWESTPGRRYMLVWSTNLTMPFVPLGGIVTAVVTTASFVDTNAAPLRFYRVEVLP